MKDCAARPIHRSENITKASTPKRAKDILSMEVYRSRDDGKASPMRAIILVLVVWLLLIVYFKSSQSSDMEKPRQYGYVWQMPNFWVEPEYLKNSHGNH